MSEAAGSPIKRSAYLLDGRRVTVRDLLDAGLLVAGATLWYKHKGKTHHAVVTEAGGVVLDDDQEFGSLSRAAAVAAGMRAVDGWHAWAVESSRRSLDSLRQELLDRVAARTAGETVRAGETLTDSQRRYERLKKARGRADAKDPEKMSVRELIALWDSKARDTRIDQRIEADLDNHGLVTSPNFRKVTIDATVQLVSASLEGVTSAVVSSDVDDAEQLDVGLTVGNLPSALGGVVSVAPTATFDEAITLMLLNSYSQLAVLSGSHSLRGAVTWKSIAQTQHFKPSASFADAIVPSSEARYDQELIEVLPKLEESDFVFVRDEKNAVAGIVTTADVVHAYGELATPFFLIGELDQVLRQLISRTFSLDEVTLLCDSGGTREIGSFDDLGMGDYQRVLENPEKWAKLGWRLNRAAFIERLDELRLVRNNVTHFNPDPVPVDAVDKLRNILRLLRHNG